MKTRRLPLMALALAALATGVLTGLRRMGWDVAVPGQATPLDHGPLMIAGFLGTLIGIERSVALGRTWVYTGPLASGIGMLGHVAGAPAILAPASATVASGVLVAALTTVVAQHPTIFHVVMAVAAASWALGNLLWLVGVSSASYVSWWMTFLVLTIAAERLELTRLLPSARGSRESFVALAMLLLLAVAAGGVGSPLPARVTGLALAALAAWLWRYDVARRTVRQQALPRFTAICLLSGYVWLAVGGVLLLSVGAVVAGPAYDAVLHAIFVGFVFTMIFGHAPIVFPAVLGVAIPFNRAFYSHLVLLHVSLLARLIADFAGATELRQWSALLNAAAIALFFANTITAVIRGRIRGEH